MSKKEIYDFKSNYFRLIKQHRSFLWHTTKKKNLNAINFQIQKRIMLTEGHSEDSQRSLVVDDDIENSIIPTFPPDHPRGLFSKLGGSQLERIGILISDQSLNRNFQESNKMEPICYGGVKVEGQLRWRLKSAIQL